jgi:hypothetical protein
MAINMNSMLMKVIGIKVCLHAKSPYGLSKDLNLGPMRRPMSQMAMPWGLII